MSTGNSYSAYGYTDKGAAASDAVAAAARDLVDRLGREASGVAADRVASLASQGRWPEHDVALRVLTAVEHLQDATKS